MPLNVQEETPGPPPVQNGWHALPTKHIQGRFTQRERLDCLSDLRPDYESRIGRRAEGTCGALHQLDLVRAFARPSIPRFVRTRIIKTDAPTLCQHA